MLAHCKEMLEYHNWQVAIHHCVKAAVENGEWMVDKEAIRHDDLFICF
jgi:hypothetical protein